MGNIGELEMKEELNKEHMMKKVHNLKPFGLVAFLVLCQNSNFLK